MTYLILSVLSTVILTVLVKVFDLQGRHRMVLLAGNYLLAAVISGGLWLVQRESESAISALPLWLGAINGVLFIGGFVLFMQSINQTGMAVTTSISRLSVAIPVLSAICFFGERLRPVQIVGVCASGLAVLLLAAGNGNQQTPAAGQSRWAHLAPAGLFVCVGLSSALMKLFEQIGRPEENDLFLFVIFAVALVISIVYLTIDQVSPQKSDVWCGLLLGIPNQLASLFTLLAIQVIPAAIAFPTTSISIMALSSLIGVLIWQEKLLTRQWVGLGLSSLAVWFMVR